MGGTDGHGWGIGCSPARRAGGCSPFRSARLTAPGYSVSGFVVAGPAGAGAVAPMAGLAEASYNKSESATEGKTASICVHLRPFAVENAGFQAGLVTPWREIAIFHRKTAPNGPKTAFSDPFSPARPVAARFRSENRLTPRRQDAEKLLGCRTLLGALGDFA